MTDDLSLSEDAFVFGDGVMKKNETVTLEKKVYDVLLKRNADLMEENDRLIGKLKGYGKMKPIEQYTADELSAKIDRLRFAFPAGSGKAYNPRVGRTGDERYGGKVQ